MSMGRFLLVLILGLNIPLHAEPTIPDDGFPAARYESLWLKFPFKLSQSSESDADGYSLVGLAKVNGVSYVNLLDRHSNQVFVITSESPSHGLLLDSLHRGVRLEDSYAVLEKGDEVVVLHLRPRIPAAVGAATHTSPASAAVPAQNTSVPTLILQSSPMIR